jgi:hypothetical protein
MVPDLCRFILARRNVASYFARAVASVTIRQPGMVMARNPPVIDWRVDLSDRTSQGLGMKIYLLMVLISAIATLSHLNLGRKPPEREA